MRGAINKLTAKAVAGKLDPGMHSDGGGLFLRVQAGGSRSWMFVYRSPTEKKVIKTTGKIVGREREMGLGLSGTNAGEVSLAAARVLADHARSLIKEGKDPLVERKRPSAATVRVPTFGEIADQYVAAHEGSWKNEKHAAQWKMTLNDYAAPIRMKPVDLVDVADVLLCLSPHWDERPETADRLRGRIERVLNAAKAGGYRTGENPAAWRGHLENLLPKRRKLSRGHHDAMPWKDVPAFIAKLRQRDGVSPLALEFLVLTACRSGEVRGALWPEFDIPAKVWTVPAIRMKAGKEHRVPLTTRMLNILDKVRPLHETSGLVFIGMIPGKPLSDMTLGAVLKRMAIENVTAHGFRSSFRDWAGSATNFPREIAEDALAHVVGNRVERSYRREDALERRRDLMAAWEAYCESGDSPVE